jgi:hypothetical protein
LQGSHKSEGEVESFCGAKFKFIELPEMQQNKSMREMQISPRAAGTQNLRQGTTCKEIERIEI